MGQFEPRGPFVVAVSQLESELLLRQSGVESVNPVQSRRLEMQALEAAEHGLRASSRPVLQGMPVVTHCPTMQRALLQMSEI